MKELLIVPVNRNKLAVISALFSMMNLLFVIVGFLSAMVVVSSTSVEAACNAFSNGLKNVVTSEGSDHASKACLICDCLLEWNDDGFLTKARLKSLKERLSAGEGVRRMSRWNVEYLRLCCNLYRNGTTKKARRWS